MKVYLAGPMTGLSEKNFPAFARQAALLRADGHDVVSPAEINEGLEHEGWGPCMRRDLVGLASCDAVYLLPGWEASRGARLEWRIAEALGMQVLHAPAVPSLEQIRAAGQVSQAHSEQLLAAHKARAADEFQRETTGG